MSLSKANIRRAQLLMHGLQASGVQDFVLSPGSRNTPLILALEWLAQLRGKDNVRIHRILDERSAAFFALGLGRISGQPAALVCTSGTAGAHYFPAVIEASQSCVPLIVLTADRPEELRGVGSLQTIDQNKLYGSYTRLYLDMGTPTADGPSDDWVVACGARVQAAACGQYPGPVHLNLPFREPLWTPGETWLDLDLPIAPKVRAGQQQLSSTQLSSVWKIVGACTRGVIIAGPRNGAVNEAEEALAQNVQKLARHLGWPVLAEPGSGVRAGLSGQDELVAPADVILRGEQFAESLAPQLVLRFGKTPTSKVLRLWAARYAKETIVIEDTPMWHDPDAALSEVIQAHPTAFFEAMSGALEPCTKDTNWLLRWRRAGELAEEVIQKLSGESFWEGAIARQVVGKLPEDSLLHVANSMPIRDLDAMVASFPKNTTVVHHRGANGIDGALSALMGEAIAAQVPALLLCGDLTFLHDVGALNFAASEQTPTTVVVLDNRGGGIFEHLPIANHPSAFERNFITPHKQDLVALSRAAGVRAYKAEDARALEDMLGEELARPGLSVIVVPTDRESNTQIHRALWQEVETLLETNLL